MPVLSNGQFLKSARINALIRDQSEAYQRRLPLRFLDRCAVTPADDEEIIGTYTGKVYSADLIADDQAAPVYDAGQFEFTTNVIPNLKVGARMTQSMMNRLVRMERGNITRDEVGIFENWEANTAANLRRGVDERRNSLICAMLIDSYTYDRLGIKLSGVSWGTPSAYKVTPATPWTNIAATPVTDVLTLKDFMANDVGEQPDRMTMPLADFRLMVATTEFRTLIPGIVGQPLAAANYNNFDVRMQGFASQILGMDIEFDDKTYVEQSAAGVITTSRVLPLGKVILGTKADDNNPAAYDWGNAIVTESIASGIIGNNATLGGVQAGPIAYYTGNEDLNPPNIIGWGVARGFPRKFRKTCVGVLTVR
jgi:hypothetical protein